jgi:RNA recognition motif-containing protein
MDLFTVNNKFSRSFKREEFAPAKPIEPPKLKKVKKLTSSEEEEKKEADAKNKEPAYPTIFISNVPHTETIESIKKFCKEFGEVQSVRLRSIPMRASIALQRYME